MLCLSIVVENCQFHVSVEFRRDVESTFLSNFAFSQNKMEMTCELLSSYKTLIPIMNIEKKE